MQPLKERLVQARNAKNLTQDALAERSGVSARTIAAYEAGGDFTSRNVEKLALALAITPAYLMGADVSATGEPVTTKQATPENIRLALRSLRNQAGALVDQIDFYERQLCGSGDAKGSMVDEERIQRLNRLALPGSKPIHKSKGSSGNEPHRP